MSSGRERLYAWDDKSLKWYVNAVEYGSFHRVVAREDDGKAAGKADGMRCGLR